MIEGANNIEPKKSGAQHQPLLPDELHPGDYAVDQLHGIGLFHGLTRRATLVAAGEKPVEREYLALEYEGGDRVYVPAEQADRVRRYVSANGVAPHLSRLKGSGWATAVAKAKESVKEVAAELVSLYASREAAVGYAYRADTLRQQQMEAAFAFTETPDQMQAIREAKADLEKPRPMDRLLVGDVGYGKTEVAVRVAFKVVEEERQTALLCPTSVLAAQHHTTFSERLAPFGVRVTLLTRFQSAEEHHEVIHGLKSGEMSIVIGTHRLLSEHVEFKNLGLIIIDEEQRFGVLHKEKLKQLRSNGDVLTMTATPIPRTLHMALAGLRDVSLMSDPPEGRLPVETIVSQYNEAIVEEAIQRELARGGQVYFLHNRVETMEDTAAHLAQMVPNARIAIAHGQLDEAALEEVMHAFYERRVDVLVCTTIIEAGVNIPNANTLIVDAADQLGLAQLYQLRGRVGRSDRQAHALLLYHDPNHLSEIARKRLTALQAFSEPGSGERIALKDLELRGAGNLLGLEQSGAASAVGMDLYLRMLEAAVRRQRGEKPLPQSSLLPTIDLPLSSCVPETYLPAERERQRLYSQLASIRDEDEIDRQRAELEAQHGPLPPELETMFTLLRLRLHCRAVGVSEVTSENGSVALRLRKGAGLSENEVSYLHQALGSQVAAASATCVVLNIMPVRAIPVLATALDALRTARRDTRRRANTKLSLAAVEDK